MENGDFLTLSFLAASEDGCPRLGDRAAARHEEPREKRKNTPSRNKRLPAHLGGSTHDSANLSSAESRTCWLQPRGRGYRAGFKHAQRCVYLLFTSLCDVIYFHAIDSSLLAVLHKICLVKKWKRKREFFFLTFLLADVGCCASASPLLLLHHHHQL